MLLQTRTARGLADRLARKAARLAEARSIQRARPDWRNPRWLWPLFTKD